MTSNHEEYSDDIILENLIKLKFKQLFGCPMAN